MSSKTITKNDLKAILEGMDIPTGSGTDDPTANTTAAFDEYAHMNSEDMSAADITNFVNSLDNVNNISKTVVLNMFYPIGSYYETSDSNFDPNIVWGGTWSIQNEKSIIYNYAESVTLTANGNTVICTINLEANTRYLILGSAGTGSSSSMTSNCDLSVSSGTTINWYKFVTNSTTSSAGATLTACAYIRTNSQCTVALNKYNYTTSAITTGNGRVVAIPLNNLIDEDKIRWHRIA